MTNRVAMITGAGSGIGRAAALTLARAGYSIGALGHSHRELAAVVDDIAALGGNAIALDADISDERQMETAVSSLVDMTGVPSFSV